MNRLAKGDKNEEGISEDRPQPLRQFSDGPGEVPSGSMERLKTIAYWGLPLLVLLFIIAAGLYLVLNDSSKSAAATPKDVDAPEANNESTVQSVPVSSKIKDFGPAALLNAYLNAIGGREAVERVQSVRYEGEVVSDGEASSFRMIVLRPDKGMLVTYSRSGAAVKYKLNGNKAWLQLDQDDGSQVIKALNEKQIKAFKWSFRVNHTFRRMALDGLADGLSVDEIEYMGVPCYKVTKAGPKGSEFMAILEKENLSLLKTREELGIGEGQIMEVVYGDYKMISGVLEPHTTKLYRDGQLDNEVTVDSIRFNLGPISSLFDVPDEIKD